MIFTTMDQEWASEDDVASVLTLAKTIDVPIYIFATNPSKVLGRLDGSSLGIHPNFLPGSTQGSSYSTVLRTLLKWYPKAKASRSHCFYDHTRLQWLIAAHGIKVDSNSIAYLQDQPPFRTAGGLWRYPVFWSDDVANRIPGHNHFDINQLLNGDTEHGIRVINFHPTIDKNLLKYILEGIKPRARDFADLL